MNEKTPRPADWPASMLDDDRTWQGDYDPYLGALARQGHRPFHAAPRANPQDAGEPGPSAESLDQASASDPGDQADPYLASLARKPPGDAAAG